MYCVHTNEINTSIETETEMKQNWNDAIVFDDCVVVALIFVVAFVCCENGKEESFWETSQQIW